ncbi:MAG: hypothetical protein NTW54_09810 [Bacteroidetes bacterium]|nr:hypothetical protein [Bacteroidota bacterium]
MKIFKSFLVLALLTLALATQAHMQQLSAEERALVLTFRMSQYLQLNESQKSEIMKAHQQFFEQMEVAKQQFGDQREMLKKRRRELFIARNTEFQKVLSKEQFERYTLKQKEEHQRMEMKREERKAAYEKRKASLPVASPKENLPTTPKK